MSSNEKTTPPPDVELRIQTDSEFGQTQLVYTLHSPAGKAPFAHRKIVGPAFSGSPEALHRRLLHQIEGLGGRLDVDGSPVYRQEVQNKLDGVGRELWNQLFNEEMRQAYRRFRSVETLLIISDEPWIPWEMVKPYDDQGEVLDDEFFAERFELTRWLAGDRSVPNEIAVRALACVVQGDNLPSAGVERDLVTGLSRSAAVRDASPASVRVETLTALLGAGGIGLFHFTGHGKLDPALSNEAGLLLADGSSFRPTDLHGPVQTQVAKDRPLVFLNACRSAGQGWSWTGLGGWANRWVRICGCGAFVGSQWNVRDSVAFAFAKAFYESLVQGATLGKAAKAAREEARKAARGTPGWLAYAIYGHPNARIIFGQDVTAEGGEVTFEPSHPSNVLIAKRVRLNSDRIRKSLEPYVLPRISRREVHEKYLPAIRESVIKQKNRIIPILGSAGFGKSTLLGEVYDALRGEDLAWVALVDSSEISFAAPSDLSLALSQATCGSEMAFEDLVAELSRDRPGVLLIDTLDLVLDPLLVPHLQRVLFTMKSTATTVVFTCRDLDYQLLLEPPYGRIPQVADRIDRYIVPAFTPSETKAAAEAFVTGKTRLRDTLAGRAFVENLLSLSADNRSLRAITSNPLLLAMLCEVFGKDGDLPHDLTVSELYDLYWSEKVARSRSRGLSSPEVLAKSRLCLLIARRILEDWHERVHDWVAESDLNLEMSSPLAQARAELLSEGILKLQSRDRIHFFHQTFLEYVMARWLATRAGSTALEGVLSSVRNKENVALHWWPVLRQLLVIVETEVFARVVDQLALESLVAFRTVSFATVTRADAQGLEVLLRRALDLGAEFQKTLCAAVESAPTRFLGDAWSVVEALLRTGAREAAILATTTAGAIFTRDQKSLAERMYKLMDAVEKRIQRTGDGEEGAEIKGQLLKSSLPALRANPDPDTLRLLQDRYLSFGEKGRGVIINFFDTALIAEQRRTDFVYFLLERPPERRLQTELVALLERTLRFEGADTKKTTEDRLNVLYRSMPEPWISFHARAVARLFPRDLQLIEEISRNLLSSEARSPRCCTNALEELAQIGAADQICNALIKVPSESIPKGRIGSLATLVREISLRAESASRLKLALWLNPVADGRPEEALEVFATVADAGEVTWSTFLARLRDIFQVGDDRLAKRAVAKVPPSALAQLAPEIEFWASRHPGKVSFEYMLVDVYSQQIGESEEALSRLVQLSLSSAKGVALAASNALVRIAPQKGAYFSVTILLPLSGSEISGVRDHLMDTIIAIQKAENHMAPEEIILLCKALADETNPPILQKLCMIVANWIRTENRVLFSIAERMADLASRLEHGGLGPGVAGALIRVLKVMAQLETPEILHLLEEAARHVLQGVDQLNRLSVGESEMIDLLSALARIDGGFLARLVEDGSELQPRNVRALAASIRRVEGSGSPLLARILSSEWCTPQAQSMILDYLGA